jgi:Mn-containing catalase
MFFHNSKLQYRVKVDKPNPLFAKVPGVHAQNEQMKEDGMFGGVFKK